MARNQVQLTQQNKPKNVKRDPVASGERDACVNRAASHDFFLLERYEAGIALRGTEVKSIRAGQANLKDSYGLVKDGELFLLNAHIGVYAPGAQFNHDTRRTRKLLVHRGSDPQTPRRRPAKGTHHRPYPDVLQKWPRQD